MNRALPAAGTDDNLQSSLSTKISVIVFWGMIVIGLLASALLLRGLEKEIAATYSTGAIEFTREIEQYVARDENFSWKELEHLAQTRHPIYGIRRVIVESGGRKISVGEQSGALTPFAHEFFHYISSDARRLQETVKVTTFFTPLEQAVSEKRKRIVMFMGATLLVFGLFLHGILRKVLSRPFQRMVQTAKSITRGEVALRFEENQTDEFGFLAKFINQALDFVTLKQKELQEALVMVRQSETELRAQKTRVEVTLHSIGDAVITTDAKGNVDYLNPAAEKLTGWLLRDIRGKSISDALQVVDENNRQPVESLVETCLREKITVGPVDHIVLLRPDGSEVDVMNTAAPICESSGPLIGVVLVFHDVGKARKMAKQLSYQASHDDLTGLYNRREFEHRLEKVAASAATDNTEHALCYMDLDQFKVVNDTCGHIAGDELLRQFAGILRNKVRDGDTVARLGGDEFGILFESCSAADAKNIADSLLKRVRDYRFSWQDQIFDIGVSIGLVSISHGSQSVAELLSAADVACYAAKDAGRNRVHVYQFDDHELKQLHRGMRWVSRLGKALDQNRFNLYCQPIVPVVKNGRVMPHHEILVRLREEDGKLVPPLAFIPSAERYNLMPAIDRWVIRATFEMIAARATTFQGWLFSINLSGQSLCDENFLDFVVGAFEKSGVPCEQICFEITETAAVANLNRATRFISILKGMGCRFSLDDFGTGLSSFSYLQTLKVDFLKIDGRFVKNITQDSVNRAIVESANTIGHAMGIQTVAEFVEDEAILAVLREIGVNYAQGYGVAKPYPVEEMLAVGLAGSRRLPG